MKFFSIAGKSTREWKSIPSPFFILRNGNPFNSIHPYMGKQLLFVPVLE